MANLNFQHRHYVAIAEALAGARRDIRNKEPDESIADMLDGVSLAEDHIVDLLRRASDRFDVARFRACAAGSPSNGRDKGR